MSNNTVQTFTVTGSVPSEPTEAVTVTAGSGVPGLPTNLTATAASQTSIVLDWDAPVGSAVTSYNVYQSSTLGGTYTNVTSGIVKAGTTATVSSLTAATAYFFKVAAVNASGIGAQTAAKTATTPAS
jgi:titin